MPKELLDNYRMHHEDASWFTSDEFTDPKDRRDVTFLLTGVFLSKKYLDGRKDVEGFFDYAINNQREMLMLAREFDAAVKAFNATANTQIDPALANTISVREEEKLGKSGTIPLLLGEGEVRPKEAVEQIVAGNKTLLAQEYYMKRSEMLGDAAKTDDEGWSEIHLSAKSPGHFLAAFIVDIYPGIMRRWLQHSPDGEKRFEKLDTDELVRALCENIDPDSELFGLINDQGWFNDAEFSDEFRAKIPVKESQGV